MDRRFCTTPPKKNWNYEEWIVEVPWVSCLWQKLLPTEEEVHTAKYIRETFSYLRSSHGNVVVKVS